MRRAISLLLALGLGGCAVLGHHSAYRLIDGADLNRDALINQVRPVGGFSVEVIVYPEYGFEDSGADCTTQTDEILVETDSVAYDPEMRLLSLRGRVLNAETRSPITDAGVWAWNRDGTSEQLASLDSAGFFSVSRTFSKREALLIYPPPRTMMAPPFRPQYFDVHKLLRR